MLPFSYRRPSRGIFSLRRFLAFAGLLLALASYGLFMSLEPNPPENLAFPGVSHHHSMHQYSPVSLVSPYSNFSCLIIVAGHAVLKRVALDKESVADPNSWFLNPGQELEVPTFLSHIKAGISLLSENSHCLLFFSGGVTRKTAGPFSEGDSYYRAAILNDFFNFPHRDSLIDRTLIESNARDSYENLIFSLCRFHEVTGDYPKEISVIGFEFKRSRFVDYHRLAIKYPLDQFHYHGLNPENPSFDLSKALDGEKRFSMIHWKENQYGCNEFLQKKRIERNPYRLHIPYGYGNSCPEMAELLHFCGPGEFPHPLPWEK